MSKVLGLGLTNPKALMCVQLDGRECESWLKQAKGEAPIPPFEVDIPASTRMLARVDMKCPGCDQKHRSAEMIHALT